MKVSELFVKLQDIMFRDPDSVLVFKLHGDDGNNDFKDLVIENVATYYGGDLLRMVVKLKEWKRNEK